MGLTMRKGSALVVPASTGCHTQADTTEGPQRQALQMQLEEMKVQPGEAQKRYENTADLVLLTYAWALVLYISTYTHYNNPYSLNNLPPAPAITRKHAGPSQNHQDSNRSTGLPSESLSGLPAPLFFNAFLSETKSNVLVNL